MVATSLACKMLPLTSSLQIHIAMHALTLQASSTICLRCQWRLLSRRRIVSPRQIHHAALQPKISPRHRRNLHATATFAQLATAPQSAPLPFDPAQLPRPENKAFRDYLAKWQHEYGGPTEETLQAFRNHPAHDEVHNSVSKLNLAITSDEGAEQHNWGQEDEPDDTEEMFTIALFLKPGDVVELTQSGREPFLAVFVQQLDQLSQFLASNGRWCHSRLHKIAFAIPGCIDPTLLAPITPYLPTAPEALDPKGGIQVPSHLAAPIQHLLDRMTKDAEKIYRLNAPVLDTAYDVLADSSRIRMMTLKQIAKALLGQGDSKWEPSSAALLAVRKALSHNSFRFMTDAQFQRMTDVVAIRPKGDVEVVETVQEWLREHGQYVAMCANMHQCDLPRPSQGVSYVLQFIEKARRLIAHSRKTREPHDTTIGSRRMDTSSTARASAMDMEWGEAFSFTDTQIINFLQGWVLNAQYQGMPSYYTACTSLMMAVGCYKVGNVRNSGKIGPAFGNVDRSIGYLFLQEIGVLSPFENCALYNEQIMLPTVRRSRNLDVLNTKAENLRKAPDFRDSMAALRQDWGSLPVYCIDDANAQEIDDGISIERVKDQTGEFWVHVHVANPTAFFEKTHPLSGLAAHMTKSIYFPERTYPMLPKWVTQGYFSLKPNRPVLTFSSRVNASGDLLETKIQPGIAREVIALRPSDLFSILDEKDTSDYRSLVVGGELPVKDRSDVVDLSARHVQDIRDLFTVAKSLWQKRKAAGSARVRRPYANVQVFENSQASGLPWHPPSVDRARFVKGDPIIKVSTELGKANVTFDITCKDIVEEMMILACRSAASWCAERGIPAAFRGTITMPQYGPKPSEDVRALVQQRLENKLKIPVRMAIEYIRSFGRAIPHFAPLQHASIGVPCYVKVTSPLRRFTDMITHWQIEAAIRYESRTGKKLGATEISRGVLPFSQSQIQESIITLSPRERMLQLVEMKSVRFWSSLALMRAIHYNEADLPATFRFWVMSPSPLVIRGVLIDYGIEAILEGAADARPGDEWEVRVTYVHVYDGHSLVQPIRLVHREDDLM